MALRIGDEAPNFQAQTTEGPIDFHEWIGDGWAVLFSHPKDFTPVCTTELGYMARIKPEFDKRNTKIIGLSRRPGGRPQALGEGHRGDAGHRGQLPDDRRPGSEDREALRHAAGRGDARQAHRGRQRRPCARCSSIGPDKKIKLMLFYPMTTGRNFDEVLRVLDSMQLTAKHKVATPANWKQGEDVIIAGSVSDEDAKKQYPRRLEGAEALPAHRRRSRSSCDQNRVPGSPRGARLACAGMTICYDRARSLTLRRRGCAGRPRRLMPTRGRAAAWPRLYHSWGCPWYWGPGWYSLLLPAARLLLPALGRASRAPPVYVERSESPGRPTQGWWYYCDESKGYYPYVKECPGGWHERAAGASRRNEKLLRIRASSLPAAPRRPAARA